MFAKILIGTGAFAIFASIFDVAWDIYQATRFNKSAGIGAVGGALLSGLVILFFAGLPVLVIGIIKFYRDKRLEKLL